MLQVEVNASDELLYAHRHRHLTLERELHLQDGSGVNRRRGRMELKPRELSEDAHTEGRHVSCGAGGVKITTYTGHMFSNTF